MSRRLSEFWSFLRPRLAVVAATCVFALLAQQPAQAAQLKAIQSGEVSMFGTSVTVPITPVDPTKTILVFGECKKSCV